MKRAFIRVEVALFTTAFVVAASLVAFAGENIKDRSPDGRFAMSLQQVKDHELGLALIDTKTHKLLVDLQDIGHPWCDRARILWTPDSKRFAFYYEDRRGSGTDVYMWKGSSFEQVELPNLPECNHPKVVPLSYFSSLTPKKWTKPDTLMLLAHDEWSPEDDKSQDRECNRIVTVLIDPSGKASIQIQENKK